MTESTLTYLIAVAGGVGPAVLWLLFWLREDRLHPEPRRLITLAFLLGMLAVVVVIPFERAVAYTFTGTAVVVLWAIIEEVAKFLAAYTYVLRNKAMNEPIDTVIYMISVALGFAALENTLFLLAPLGDGLIIETILTGNLRFIGATLLHTLASATVGAALAFSFYRGRVARELLLLVGLILASALHALFNFFILKSNGANPELMGTFLAVWFGVIVLILLFEKIKRIRSPRDIFIK